MPKASVTMGLKLAFAGEALERFALEDAIVTGEIIANTFVEDAEAAVDIAWPAVGFFAESGDGAFADGELAEATGGFHGGSGGDCPVGFVKLDGGVEVAVGDAVAIGEQEIFILHMRQSARETTAGLGGGAGVEQRHVPVLLIVMGVVLHLRLAADRFFGTL